MAILKDICHDCHGPTAHGEGEDPFCPKCEYPRVPQNYPIKDVHVFLSGGWWYFCLGKHNRYGRVMGGFLELGALYAKIKGGDVGLREWSKANPPTHS